MVSHSLEGPDGLKDSFALGPETPEDENPLLTDGVDDPSDIFVVKEAVDELSDFEIVNDNG
jgi:hypothetical protein